MDIEDPGTRSSTGTKAKPAGGKEKILPLPNSDDKATFGSFDFWKKEIKAAEQKRDDDYKPDWDHNIVSYKAKNLISTPDVDKIIVPKDFANVEQKKAQLFFQLPLIHCTSEDPDLQDTVPLAQAILRFYLSRHRVDAMTMMNEVLFDAICASAMMWSKIGYESVQDGTKPVQIQQPNPQAGQPAPPAPPLGAAPAVQNGPTQAPGSVLGLNAPAQPPTLPVTVDAPRIISERYFWERISPAKGLLPEKFVGSNYDLAPWIGFEFVEPWDVVKRKYKLSDEDVSRFSGDDDHKIRSEKNVTTRAAVDSVRGYEIYYRAAIYDPTVKNPDQIRLLVLLDGYDKPVRHRDSPYQKIDPISGQVIGMKGYPVHVGAMRYVSDAAFPTSEVSVTRTLVDEEGKYFTQLSQQRDRGVAQIGFDPTRIGGPQTEEKIRRGIYAGWIPIPGFDPDHPPAAELAKPHVSPDNYRGMDYFDRAISEAWAFGPNQRGEEAQESRTATELSLAQQAASTRIGKDRERVVDYFMKGAEKLWALIQLFATDEQYIRIIGQNGVARFQKWDKTQIAGDFVFETKPDSAMQPDANQDRNMLLKEYELLRRDPNWNSIPMLQQIARVFDQDPADCVVEQLPPKGPEPAKIAFTMKLEDLDQGNANFPLYIAILRQSGYQIPDDMLMQMAAHKQQQSAIMTQMSAMGIGGDGAQAAMSGLLPAGNAGGTIPGTISPTPQHGGMAPKAERLNKHQEKQTGQPKGAKPLNQRPNNGIQ